MKISGNLEVLLKANSRGIKIFVPNLSGFGLIHVGVVILELEGANAFIRLICTLLHF